MIPTDPPPLDDRLEALLGARPLRFVPLAGGSAGQAKVLRADFAGGDPCVLKVAPPGPPLDAPDPSTDALALEGWMLSELARRSDLPVPGVIHAEPGLLVMEWVEADGARSPEGEAEAAEQIAALHAVEGSHFGYAADTVLGGIHLPNPPTADWNTFYAEHRLRDMARRCVAVGLLPAELARGVEVVADRLEEFLGSEPGPPSLVHGDLWGGNVLWHRGRVAAYIDPAVHHAPAEVEIAFTTLFPTFGPAFHTRYRALRPLDPGFDEVRRELHHLHPLLVHVRLFGGSYVDAVRRVVRRCEA